MFPIAPATLVSLALLQGFTVKDPTPPKAIPIMRIGESFVDLHLSGTTASSCLVVWRDGSVHLEKRIQKLPRREASLHIYEGILNTFEMDRLEAILEAPELRDLGAYTAPKFPVAVPTIAMVQVKIMRQEKVQAIGYFAWNRVPGSEHASPESTSEEVKREWQVSRVTLAPLVGWFHETSGRDWQEVDQAHSTLCNVPSMDTLP